MTPTLSRILYSGYYYSPEGDYIRATIPPSQVTVNGQVRCAVYKGGFMVLGRSSQTEKLYDATAASMDELTDFDPVDTTGFISVQSIRIKKYGEAKHEKGESY